MINNFKDYPYLKDKKELFESIIDEEFEFIIDTYFNNTFTTTDDIILSFKKGIKRSIYNFYYNNRIACKNDDTIINIMFCNFLDDKLINDIPMYNYFYKLSNNLESKLLNNGSYTDSVTYKDSQKDTTQSNFNSNGVVDSDSSSSTNATAKEDLSSFSKNADTPTITLASDEFVDKYTNTQSKDSSSGSSSNDTTSKVTNSTTNTLSNTTDKSYSKDSEYSKNVTHKEESSLKDQLDIINNAKNDIIVSYVTALKDCFIRFEELYDLYEGDE